MKKDNGDIATLISLIKERDPFNTARTDLGSLSSGLIADKNVNCDDAKNVGEIILKGMRGKVIADYHFSKKSSQNISLLQVCKDFRWRTNRTGSTTPLSKSSSSRLKRILC